MNKVYNFIDNHPVLLFIVGVFLLVIGACIFIEATAGSLISHLIALALIPMLFILYTVSIATLITVVAMYVYEHLI